MLASNTLDSGWVRLGAVPPTDLADARLQLHHATQIAVSATISYLVAQPDDSHTALSWSGPHGALVTEPISAARPFRIGLRVRDLTLHAFDEAMRATQPFALSGKTMADAYAWLSEVASSAGLPRERLTSSKHYTIPGHPVADGAPFSVGSGDELAELERYWSNAANLLEALVLNVDGASGVRCWPHHFDIATLITLPAATGRRQRTIGVGHSPGDEWYAEPYWYVGPYPYPETSEFPPVDGGGHWHTKGWVGAALPASSYAAADGLGQRQQVVTFIDSAVKACRTLLGADAV
jgi:hypothetical protein